MNWSLAYAVIGLVMDGAIAAMYLLGSVELVPAWMVGVLFLAKVPASIGSVIKEARK